MQRGPPINLFGLISSPYTQIRILLTDEKDEKGIPW